MWVLENSSRDWVEEKKLQKRISLNGQRGKEKISKSMMSWCKKRVFLEGISDQLCKMLLRVSVTWEKECHHWTWRYGEYRRPQEHQWYGVLAPYRGMNENWRKLDYWCLLRAWFLKMVKRYRLEQVRLGKNWNTRK